MERNLMNELTEGIDALGTIRKYQKDLEEKQKIIDEQKKEIEELKESVAYYSDMMYHYMERNEQD